MADAALPRSQPAALPFAAVQEGDSPGAAKAESASWRPAATPSADVPPTLLGQAAEPLRFGDYEVTGILGQGGMGIVYAARSPQHKRVAIKVMRPDLARHPELAERFINEVKAANVVDHPGVVNILHVARSPDGTPYMVIEFLEGTPLNSAIAAGPIGLPRAIRLGWQIALALTAAHERNIVHRDLKPANVFIVPDPTIPGHERTKILDFGVAKLNFTDSDLRHRTSAGALVGTLAYMSPEQRIDSSQVDAKTDVYALGLMLYEMLTGKLVAVRVPLGKAIPKRLASLIARMLLDNPQLRPTTLQVARELQQLGGDRADGAPTSGRLPLALAGGLLVSAIAVAAVFAWPSRRGPAQPEPVDLARGAATPPAKEPTAPERAAAGMVVFAAGLVAGQAQSFALDREEVTNLDFARWAGPLGGLTFARETYRLRQGDTLLSSLTPPISGLDYTGSTLKARAGAERKPVVLVSWFAAELYCRAHGKRLPTETEWELAARGPKKDRRYPWGQRIPQCFEVAYGRSAADRTSRCVGDGPEDVGTQTQDVTFEGAHDLGGNVAEWTATAGQGAGMQVVRGGDWSRPAAALQGASRMQLARQSVTPSVGFRCAKSLP